LSSPINSDSFLSGISCCGPLSLGSPSLISSIPPSSSSSFGFLFFSIKIIKQNEVFLIEKFLIIFKSEIKFILLIIFN
jgi:hypothetical protein